MSQYVYIYVYMNKTRMCVCVRVCLCVFVYVYLYVHICMYALIFWIITVHTYVHTYTHVHVHVHMYIYKNTYAHDVHMWYMFELVYVYVCNRRADKVGQDQHSKISTPRPQRLCTLRLQIIKVVYFENRKSDPAFMCLLCVGFSWYESLTLHSSLMIQGAP